MNRVEKEEKKKRTKNRKRGRDKEIHHIHFGMVKQYRISVAFCKTNKRSIGHVGCLSHAKQEHKWSFRISGMICSLHIFRMSPLSNPQVHRQGDGGPEK